MDLEQLGVLPGYFLLVRDLALDRGHLAGLFTERKIGEHRGDDRADGEDRSRYRGKDYRAKQGHGGSLERAGAIRP